MNSHSLHQDRPALAPEEWEEVRRDLTADLPAIATHFLYDDVGSELFEEITGLPEYYQTRTELAILEEQGDQIAADADPIQLAELGSGAGRKIGLVIDAMERAAGCRALALFDVNATFLNDSVERIAGIHPKVDVRGVVGRFGPDLQRLVPGGRRMRRFCSVSTIMGNKEK